VLGVVDSCRRLVDDHQVPVAEVEGVDFSPLLRAGAETWPHDDSAVVTRGEHVQATLEALR
jgi:V/A-type H+-transporting ATPase subunit A